MHTLSLEYSSLFADYLKKVEQSIEKTKNESMIKLNRKVLFNCGVDFHGTNRSDEQHPDDYMRLGCEDFKNKSVRI